MILRLLLLSSLSVLMFSSGTYTGWRAARWLDPLLDAKDRSAPSVKPSEVYSMSNRRDLNQELFGGATLHLLPHPRQLPGKSA